MAKNNGYKSIEDFLEKNDELVNIIGFMSGKSIGGFEDEEGTAATMDEIRNTIGSNAEWRYENEYDENIHGKDYDKYLNSKIIEMINEPDYSDNLLRDLYNYNYNPYDDMGRNLDLELLKDLYRSDSYASNLSEVVEQYNNLTNDYYDSEDYNSSKESIPRYEEISGNYEEAIKKVFLDWNIDENERQLYNFYNQSESNDEQDDSLDMFGGLAPSDRMQLMQAKRIPMIDAQNKAAELNAMAGMNEVIPEVSPVIPEVPYDTGNMVSNTNLSTENVFNPIRK